MIIKLPTEKQQYHDYLDNLKMFEPILSFIDWKLKKQAGLL